MTDDFKNKNFFSKIAKPREKLINFDEKLKTRLNHKKVGPKAKELLLKDYVIIFPDTTNIVHIKSLLFRIFILIMTHNEHGGV